MTDEANYNDASYNERVVARIAARWRLTIRRCVADTPRARVFQVSSPKGHSALKLYKKLAAGGRCSHTVPAVPT